MLRLLRRRKGQFYILIALLLISYAFTLARQDVPAGKPKDAFQLLHEGYIEEGAVVINNAVYEDANVSSRFASFTDSYVAFAKSAEPGFRLVYLLRNNGLLVVGNRLDSVINVTVGLANYAVASNADLTVPASDAAISLGGASYSFSFSGEDLQLKAMFRSSDRLATRVFVRG